MAKKRGPNEGCISKRKDGRWEARISLGGSKRKCYYAKSYEDALVELTKARSDQQKGIPIVTERQSVKDYLHSWLEESVKPGVRLSTYLSYKQQVDIHITPALGRVQLTKLTPQHIQRYMNDKAKPIPQPGGDSKPGLSAKTIRYHRSILVMALTQALKWGLVARNVATLVDPPRALKYEIQPMAPEQARKFLQAIKGHRFEALFTVALSLGLRRGEALGLHWEDIDFEKRTLRVNRSLSRINHELVLSEPKTKQSRRVLDLPESLAVRLREHRTRQLEERLQAGRDWVETGMVFTSRVGTPIDPRHVKRHLDPLLVNAGLPHFRVHDLRHFCASLLLAQGVPLKVVSDLLGHTQISITADLYTHVLPEVRKEAIVDLVDRILVVQK
jgi:integrase